MYFVRIGAPGRRTSFPLSSRSVLVGCTAFEARPGVSHGRTMIRSEECIVDALFDAYNFAE
jgi:hypothetical protein